MADLVTPNLKLAYWIAHRHRFAGVDPDDVLQEAVWALCDAARTHRGPGPFVAYAGMKIRCHLINLYRKEKRRRERQRPLGDVAERAYETPLDRPDVRDLILRAPLTALQRDTLWRLIIERQTSTRIAKLRGITKAGVNNVRRRATRVIRRWLEDRPTAA